MEYTLSVDELRYRQSLPLDVKVAMTRTRIREFINEYGTDGVYVSFSGGKDSTVLLDIARKDYPEIQAVFLDTWLEYPEIREYVKQFSNVEVIKPTMSMREIINQYGWCFPSKDVAEAIWYARKGSQWAINKLNGLDKEGNVSEYRQQYKKWIPLYESELLISPFCCIKQKEEPIAEYEKETGRHPLVALMAEESARRKEAYLRTGCNSFDSDRPISKPMGYWTENDVLTYAKKNNIILASPYGQIEEVGQMDGQVSLDCLNCQYRTTGESRTGCMFCPVGGHLNNFSKLERLKGRNQKVHDYCMEELKEKELVEWVRKNYLSR